MKKSVFWLGLFDWLTMIVSALGVLLILSPLAIAKVMQNSELRLWIISGPSPFDRMGSGPYFGAMSIGLIVVGLALLGAGMLGRAFFKYATSRSQETNQDTLTP